MNKLHATKVVFIDLEILLMWLFEILEHLYPQKQKGKREIYGSLKKNKEAFYKL